MTAYYINLIAIVIFYVVGFVGFLITLTIHSCEEGCECNFFQYRFNNYIIKNNVFHNYMWNVWID